eukprot:360951-Chlamydomonas_euryale.AAC.3
MGGRGILNSFAHVQLQPVAGHSSCTDRVAAVDKWRGVAPGVGEDASADLLRGETEFWADCFGSRVFCPPGTTHQTCTACGGDRHAYFDGCCNTLRSCSAMWLNMSWHLAAHALLELEGLLRRVAGSQLAKLSPTRPWANWRPAACAAKHSHAACECPAVIAPAPCSNHMQHTANAQPRSYKPKGSSLWLSMQQDARPPSFTLMQYHSFLLYGHSAFAREAIGAPSSATWTHACCWSMAAPGLTDHAFG